MIKINSLSKVAVDLLERVYKVYPTDKPITHWLKECDKGCAFLFTQELEGNVVYAGIVEICSGGLNARFGGGMDFSWDVDEVHSFLVDVCNKLGKEKLRLTGRVGWWKHLKKFGFKKVDKFANKNARLSVVYEKDIKKGRR